MGKGRKKNKKAESPPTEKRGAGEAGGGEGGTRATGGWLELGGPKPELAATPTRDEAREEELGPLERLRAFHGRAEAFFQGLLRRTPDFVVKLLVALALVGTSAIVFSHLHAGFREAHDLPDHVAMATQFREGLAEGELYPRWNGSFNYGLGEPTGIFYPPGLPALAALVSFGPRFDVLSALYLVLFCLTVVGMAGMYTLTRKVAGRGTSLLACVIFALIPFRTFELYTAGLLSAYSAGCFLPWLLGALIDASPRAERSRGTVTTALRIGVAYGAIIFFNLPLAVLTAYLVAFWAIVEALTSLSLKPLLITATGGLLGALLAAVYLFPAVLEMPNIVVPHSDGEPLFQSNFVFQMKGSWMSASLWSVFARMAGFQAALLIVGILAVVWRLYALYLAGEDTPETTNVWLRTLAVFGLTSLFLMTPLSWWLWERLPVLQRVDMPWRLLDGLAAPSAAVFAAVVGSFVAMLSRRRWIGLATAGVVMVFTFSLFYDFQIAIASMNDRVEDSRPERLARRFYRRTGYFLPQGVAEPRSLRHHPLVDVRTPDCRVEIREWTNARRRFRVNSPEAASLVLRTFHFPGWKATVESGPEPREVTLGQDPETGLVTLDLPPGEREVTVSFGFTLYRALALAASVMTALAMIYFGWRYRRPVSEDEEVPERGVMAMLEEALESS